MEKTLVTFNTAKLAKEKGFKPDREWNPTYVDGYKVDEDTDKEELTQFKEEDYGVEGWYLAPTQNTVQKWLREKHERDVLVTKLKSGYYSFTLHFEGQKFSSLYSAQTYESTLEKGLYEALKLLKQ